MGCMFVCGSVYVCASAGCICRTVVVRFCIWVYGDYCRLFSHSIFSLPCIRLSVHILVIQVFMCLHKYITVVYCSGTTRANYSNYIDVPWSHMCEYVNHPSNLWTQAAKVSWNSLHTQTGTVSSRWWHSTGTCTWIYWCLIRGIVILPVFLFVQPFMYSTYRRYFIYSYIPHACR